jgi:hypothetical protein
MKDIHATEGADSLAQSAHAGEIVCTDGSPHGDVRDGVPKLVVSLQTSEEFTVAAMRRDDDERVEPERWQALGDVEHVFADATACRFADQSNSQPGLHHVAGTPWRLRRDLTETIHEYGTANLPNVFRIP